MKFTSSIKNSIDVENIRAALGEVPVGELLTYDAITEIIGAPAKEKRFLILAAIQKINKDTGALFVPVTRVGYRRLPASESYIIGVNTRSKIRRSARRTGQRIINAIRGVNDMPRENLLRANREIAMLGLIEHVSSERAAKIGETEQPTIKPVSKIMSEMLAAMMPKGEK